MRGATYDRVYAALKDRLLAGAFTAGDSLEPAALSAALNSSVTPVRDALHHLAGEQLVESRRHDGFRVPILTETGLRDLFTWSAQLCQLILRHATSPRSDELQPRVPDQPALVTARLFRRMAAWSNNREHGGLIDSLNDRLQRVRVVEVQVFKDLVVELETIEAEADARDIGALRDLISSYHRRRIKAVPLLTTLLVAPHRSGM